MRVSDHARRCGGRGNHHYLPAGRVVGVDDRAHLLAFAKECLHVVDAV